MGTQESRDEVAESKARREAGGSQPRSSFLSPSADPEDIDFTRALSIAPSGSDEPIFDFSGLSDDVLIIDVGSRYVRCGLSCDDVPSVVFPTVVGNEVGSERSVMGDALMSRLDDDSLDLQFPIQRGMVANWENLEKILNHALFHELQINPEGNRLFLTVPVDFSSEDLMRIAKFAFETLNVPAFLTAPHPYLAFMSTPTVAMISGGQTGVAMVCGFGMTQVCSIHQGRIVPGSELSIPLGGVDVSVRLGNLLRMDGSPHFNFGQLDVIRKLKESVCYVSSCPEEENAEEMTYELPDGSTVAVAAPRHQASEVLFRPGLRPAVLGEESWSQHQRESIRAFGIHEVCHRSLCAAPLQERNRLYRNILLYGGGSRLPGLASRMQTQIGYRGRLAPEDTYIRVKVCPQQYAVWRGARIISANPKFMASRIVTRDEYLEYGESAFIGKGK